MVAQFAQQVLAVLAFVSIFLLSNAAYRGNDYPETECPQPCQCYTFMGVRSAYCNRTGITNIPSGIPVSTQLLDVSGNSITKIPRDALVGLVNLETFIFDFANMNQVVVEPGALEMPKLQTFSLGYNGFTTIPDFLPAKMTQLYFYNNNMKVLWANSFINYPNLTYLTLSYNGMEKIESGAFDPLSSLVDVDISFNSLNDTSFPIFVFSKNQNVTYIHLRFNHLNHVLQNLPGSLVHMDYVGNHIKTIPSFAFKNQPKLQTIEFWQGEITTIEDNAFFGLSELTILDFMQDKVSSTITKDTFNGLTGLQTLYMDLNNVSKIEPGAFRSFSSITSLWFSANQLSTLDPEVLDVNYIPHLSELYIDDNPWYCDCHLRWLREKVDNASYVIQDPHLITCSGPSNLAGKAWDDLQPSDFVCP